MSEHDPTMAEAVAEYRRANGFPEDGGAGERVAKVKLGPLVMPVPNIRARAEALPRHDLHHTLLGCDSSFRGEAIVGAWEVAAGCGRFWVATFFGAQAAFHGLFVCPRETVRAFALGRRSRTLYHGPWDDRWLATRRSELRARLLPAEAPRPGLADLALYLAWAGLGLLFVALFLAAIALPTLAFSARELLVSRRTGRTAYPPSRSRSVAGNHAKAAW